ncbi:MAG: hypothetical protein NVSMB17_18020 [Candidatus Dormibacteria bacterium]
MPAIADARLGRDGVRVYTEGSAATTALVAAVAGSRRSVDAEIYEFDRRELVEGLLDARRRGVPVRMVGDPTVPVTVRTGRRLAAAGAAVGFFPVGPRQIDHVKLLIVDDRVAFFGGVNWGARSYRNHDFELRVEGPVVTRLRRIFAADLVRSGIPAAPVTALAAEPGEAAVLTSFPGDDIGRAVVAALKGARRSIKLESFVLTDKATLVALEDAARRGVHVQALFDTGQDLNQAAVARLRPAGVQCRFYRSSGEKLHAKTAVLDGDLLVLGSANWTASGFRHNHELDAVLRNRALAAAVEARMERDWAAAA